MRLSATQSETWGEFWSACKRRLPIPQWSALARDTVCELSEGCDFEAFRTVCEEQIALGIAMAQQQIEVARRVRDPKEASDET